MRRKMAPSIWHIVFGVIDYNRMGVEQENMLKIGHPKEGVNSIKIGNEHQV